MFEDFNLQIVLTIAAILLVPLLFTRMQQRVFAKSSDPPIVPYWIPIIGSTVTYGIDPFKFFRDCQKKFGDIFTFVLLGRKITVYLGPKGNQFILNGKHKDLNAEEIYSVLTTPVFGKDVVYDCPNAKFMEQKKFLKGGLASGALRSYVPLIEDEVNKYLTSTPTFDSSGGTLSITETMAQITLFTAARTLQGQEVREKLDTTFAQLYHALDDGFQPINFMLPWFPLPANRRRDIAQRKMTQIYGDIIQTRRQREAQDSEDMLWTLMSSVYKDGTPMPDSEIAHMMIALLMAGQHNTSAASAWIMLHLAAAPSIQEELYQEQLRVLGDGSVPLQYDQMGKLMLLSDVIKETLRLHPAIHSILRKVKNPLSVPGTSVVVPPSHVLLASPAAMGKSDEYFPNADTWDPYRWRHIADPKEQEKEMADYGYGLVSTGADSMYLPFGAGRHRCIGESFANLQLAVVVTLMVRVFKFWNVDGTEGVVDTDYSSMFLRPMDPALVQWEKRPVRNRGTEKQRGTHSKQPAQ